MIKDYDIDEPWLIYGYAEDGKEYANDTVIAIRKLFGERIFDGTREGFHTSGHADIETLS